MRLGKKYLKKFKHDCLGEDALRVVIKVNFPTIHRVAYISNVYNKRYDNLTYWKNENETEIIADSIEELKMKLDVIGISAENCVFCPICETNFAVIPYFPHLNMSYPLNEYLKLKENKNGLH